MPTLLDMLLCAYQDRQASSRQAGMTGMSALLLEAPTGG